MSHADTPPMDQGGILVSGKSHTLQQKQAMNVPYHKGIWVRIRAWDLVFLVILSSLFAAWGQDKIVNSYGC